MRIGYFGGTFDPPHRGHLAVAKAARDAFQLDRVLLAPTGKQPLKPHQQSAPFADRLAMTTLLCRGERGLHASNIDGPLADGAPNYTIDTLRRLRNRVPHATRLFAIVGADAFLDLPRWRDPQGLLAAAEWIVVSRPGMVSDPPTGRSRLSQEPAHVHWLRDLHVDIASTGIRQLLVGDRPVAGQLTPAVERYLIRHCLYGH